MKTVSASSTSDAPAGSAAAFFAMSWTAAQAADLGAGASVLLLIREDDGVLRPQASAPPDWTPPEALRAAAAAAAEHGRPAFRPSGPGRHAIAIAVRTDGIEAVAGAEIVAETEAQTTVALRRLQWGAGAVEAYLLRRRLPAAVPASADDGALQALRVLIRALETRRYRDAARTAATEIARVLGAERVAIARRRGRLARVEAISHAADFRGRTHALDLLTAAAEECLDQREALFYPPEAGDAPRARRQLEALAQETGHRAVAALPIGDVEAPWGAVVAEFDDPARARDALPMLDLAGDALAPLLEVKRRDDRFWTTRAAEGLWRLSGQLFGPRALGWKLLGAMLIGLAVLLATVTAPARVTADAEITSEDRVVIAAPFDGFLAERHARVGDELQAGAVLLRLDDRDLQLDLLRQEAARRQKEIERDAAGAANDRARLSVVTAEIAENDAQIALTRAQIEASRLRAPFDGTVTRDTTEGKTGGPVGRGEELMAMAPRDRRNLTLHVPDSEIDRIAPAQTGTLRLSAMPNLPLGFEVTRVTPLTAPRDGVNTFRVEARLTGEVPPDLGLGMEGVAKVVTGTDLWVLTWARPFAERLRLRLWSVWP
jgi:multidrug resistance efflux pump